MSPRAIYLRLSFTFAWTNVSGFLQRASRVFCQTLDSDPEMPKRAQAATYYMK